MVSRSDENHMDLIMRCLMAREAMNTPILYYLAKYGTSKGFQDVWICHAGNVQPKAIIMRHFNHMYLHVASDDADYEEIASFSSYCDPDYIWSGLKDLMLIKPYIPGYRLEASRHMILDGQDKLESCECCERALADDSRELARLIYGEEEFKRFYSSEDEIEMGLRRRMELGECACVVIRDGAMIKGQAYATIETENYVTIGGVITRPEFRRRGIAGQVVSGMCSLILERGKIPNLFYRDDRAGSLYRRLGFVEDGEYGLLCKIM